jgi:hypothetical protein
LKPPFRRAMNPASFCPFWAGLFNCAQFQAAPMM